MFSAKCQSVITIYFHSSSQRLYIMRKKLLIVSILAVLLCSIIVPVSAGEMNERMGYVIAPWSDFSGMARALPIVGTVTNGQSVDHIYSISSSSLMSDTWLVTVYGESITGIQPYTLVINEK